MAPTITPFNEIGVATTGGTWSYTGSGSTGVAPLPPDPPALYDDELDFDGVAAGTYTYKYTVSEVGCDDAETTLTINVFKAIPVKNDECSTPRIMVFPYNGGTSITYNQTLDSDCPGTTAPTLSAIDLPTEWDGIDVGVDIWYKVTFDPTYPPVPIIACSFTVDGNPYGTEGVLEPLLAIYSDCNAVDLIEAEVPQGGTKEINITLTDMFTTAQTFLLRVACPEGYEGNFDLTLTV